MLLFWKVNFNTFSASFISQYIFQELLMKFLGWYWWNCHLYEEYIYYSEMNLHATICSEIECCAAWERKVWNIPRLFHRVEDCMALTSLHAGIPNALCWYWLPRSVKRVYQLEKNCPLTSGIYFSPVPVTIENYK